MRGAATLVGVAEPVTHDDARPGPGHGGGTASSFVDPVAEDLEPAWLASGEAVVEWFSLTPTADDHALLNEEERARRDRIVIPAKQDQLVAARALLRRRLSRLAGLPATELQFVYGADGRPGLRGGVHLADGREVDFNLSHSGVWGVLAVVAGTRVGVDVEQCRLGRDFRGIVERFYSEAELAVMSTLEDAVLPQVFYRAWAQKEAYLKAWGTGLRFPSSAFTVELDLDAPPRILDTTMPGDEPSRWTLLDLPGPEGYATSLCLEGAPRRVRVLTRALR